MAGMTVPTSDGQVTPASLPGVQESSVASPELFGAAASKLNAAGAAASDVGNKLTNAAKQVQEREDVDKTFAALNTLKSSYIPVHTAAAQTQGEDAYGIAKSTGEWWDKQTSDIAATLTPTQQRAFNQQASALKLQSVDTLSFHEGQQRRESVVNNGLKSIGLTTGLAVAQVGTPTEATAIVEAKGSINQQLETLNAVSGWNHGPQYDAAKMVALTNLHQQAIQQLQQSQPASAKAYFDKYKDEIDPTKQAEIGKQATITTAVAMGTGAANDTWAEMGPKTTADPINMFDMEEKVRTSLKGNDAAIENGIKTLREKQASYAAQRTEQSASISANVSELILKGVSGSALRSSPQFIALNAADPKAALAMDNAATSKAYTELSRANAAESLAFTREQRAQTRLSTQTNAAFFAYSDPDVVAGMSRNAIAALLPSIGPEHTQRLLMIKDGFDKSADKLATARLDEQTFKQLAVQAGMNPDKKGLSEDDKDRFVQLKGAINQQLETAQAQKGQPLAPDERRKIAQQAFDNKVQTPGFFNVLGYGTGNTMPAGALKPEEQGSAFVDVPARNGKGTERVTLSSVPAQFRIEATAKLRAAGRKVDEATIANTWVLNRDEWKRANK